MEVLLQGAGRKRKGWLRCILLIRAHSWEGHILGSIVGVAFIIHNCAQMSISYGCLFSDLYFLNLSLMFFWWRWFKGLFFCIALVSLPLQYSIFNNNISIMFPIRKRRCILIAVFWTLWMEGNKRIFEGKERKARSWYGKEYIWHLFGHLVWKFLKGIQFFISYITGERETHISLNVCVFFSSPSLFGCLLC